MNSAKRSSVSTGANQTVAMPEYSHAHWMAMALREAERGLYTTHPNPRVGCVLVKDNVLIATGFHARAGEGHAEARALAAAGEQARGATCYATLEPCSFFGRTPACSDALINAGVARLVYAMTDPHPGNCGEGLEKLRAAGMEVIGPVLEESARTLNPGHVRRFEAGMPYVRAKLAMSLDGKTALASGASQWITGSAARQDVQRLRARSSAIVTGVDTVIADNPSLTVRAGELGGDDSTAALAAAIHRPIIVLDTALRIPSAAGLLANPMTRIACAPEAAAASSRGDVQTLVVQRGQSGHLDLADLLRQLAAQDCNEVLFECGATLAGSLVAAGLVDELVIYIAPRLMGANARSLLNLPAIDTMGDLVELEISDVRSVGQDLRITARPVKA